MHQICPSTVRLATAQDEPSLLCLLQQMHEDVGLFTYSADRVRELVHPVLSPNGVTPPVPTIIGVIGEPDDLQASICVMASRVYYSDEWHLGDLWNFVRDDSRRSGHAKALLEFGKVCADKLTLDFLSGVVSTDRTEQKMRLYRRRFGTSIGGFFRYRHHRQGSN